MRAAGKWIAALAFSTLCLLAFAVHPPEAFSESSYLLVRGGALIPESSDLENYNTGAGADVVVGHFFNSFLSGELEGGYFESKNGSSKLTVYPLTLAARLRVPIPVVKPYAILGGGAYFTTLDTPSSGSKDDTAFGYFAGAGVDFKIAVLLVNIEARYLWAEPSYSGTSTKIDSMVVMAGVGLEF
jgi:opacity protein-like surface antigen